MIEIKPHPTLDGILIRSDGWVFLPKKKGTAEHWTQGSINNHGYRKIGYNHKNYLVHRLIAETFIPNPENKPCIDHIDRDRLNNNVSNLRWSTIKENNLNQKKNLPIGQRSIDYEDVKDYNNERSKRWRDENKEHYLKLNKEKCKRFRERNPNYNKERLKKFREEHPDYYKKYYKKKGRGTSSNPL